MDLSFTLVSTTFNEAHRIDLSISEIEAQRLLPTFIIVVDAGSKDGTYEKLLQWKSKSKIQIDVLSKPGCNVAAGRNIAIRKAKTQLIVSTDFGCHYHPSWLESIVSPFKDDAALEVVGGVFTIWKEDIVKVAQKADYILQNGYQVELNNHFSVSSRSIAYKKYVWEKVGGYPESLTLAADDTIFWRQIKRLGFRYQLVDKPFVYWMRHKTFKGFAKEAGRYGLGDGESGINGRSYFSNGVETLLRYSLFLHLIVVPFYIGSTWHPTVLFILQIGGLRSYVRAMRLWWRLRSAEYGLAILMACFWMIEISRYNYLMGYTKGWLNRNDDQKTLVKKLRSEIA